MVQMCSQARTHALAASGTHRQTNACIFFSYRDVWGLRRLIGSGIQKSFVFHSVLCVDQSLAPVQLYSCTLHTQCIWRCNACAVQDERSAMCAFRWMCKFILLEIFIVIHLFSCNLYQTRLFSCLFFFFFAVFWPKFCVMCGHIAEKRLLLFGPRAWRSFRVAEHFFYSFLRVSLSRAVMEEHAQHPQMHLGIVGIEGCGPWIFLYFSKVSRSRCLIVLIFCIFEGSWPSQSVIRGIRKCRETVSAVKL